MTLPWPAPDYQGACLTQILPSALAVLTGTAPDASARRLPLPAAQRVVVVLVDGLGHSLLPAALPHAPFLAGMTPLLPDGIDAVFPSTTAASLTSFGTGLPPGGHGIVGAAFWLPELGGVLFPLSWRDRPSAAVVQPEPTVLQRAAAAGVAVTVVAARAFAGSGLTLAALSGGLYVGADSPGETVVAVTRAAQVPAPALVYGYFSAVDKSGHVHGVRSEEWALDIGHTDRAIAQIAERLPSGTLLLVTGDHGMIDCPAESRVSIDDPRFGVGVRRIAGEPRMRHVYASPGVSPVELAVRWQRLLGQSAVVLTRPEAIGLGLFGPVAHGVEERIGDVLALPAADTALVSERVDSRASGLLGQHGGLTDAERKVPLLSWIADT